MMGYLGLAQPYNSTWFDGRNVTVFPNGKVIDRNTGYIVRKGDGIDRYEEPQNVAIQSMPVQEQRPIIIRQPEQKNNDLILIALTGLIIVGIIAVMKND